MLVLIIINFLVLNILKPVLLYILPIILLKLIFFVFYDYLISFLVSLVKNTAFLN